MNTILKWIWHKSVGPVYLRLRMKRKVDWYDKRMLSALKRIKEQKKAKIVFFAINEGMWKCDELFKKLLNDSRFEPIVVSYLFPIDTEDYRKYVQDSMRAFFTAKNYPYIDSYNFDTGEWLDIKKICPDVVFYTQPYNAGYPQYKFENLWDTCLFIYIPYCYEMEHIPNYHNLPLQNICWKIFYPTNLHKQLGEMYAYNKGRNIVVTGYPMSDTLITESRTEWDGWKEQNREIKRIIWAPHHSIRDDSTLHNSNFLDLAEPMIDLVKKYEGKVQFAFKPHPRLITQLQKHPDWGIKRTQDYYRKWAEMPNTIFVEGEYTDLFKSSDALIHDCSSFMGEYLNTGNPLLFVAKHDPTEIMNDFGKACYSQHYIGSDIVDIRHFIDDVVIAGNDPMREQRLKFFNDILKPPYGRTVAENMYNEMLELVE